MRVAFLRSAAFLVSACIASLPAPATPVEDLAAASPAAAAAVKQRHPNGVISGFAKKTAGELTYFEVAVRDANVAHAIEVAADGRIGSVASDYPANRLTIPVRQTVFAFTHQAPVQTVTRREVWGIPRGASYEPINPARVFFEVGYTENGVRRMVVIGVDGRVVSNQPIR